MSSFAQVIASLTVDALDGFDRDDAVAAGWSSTMASDWERAADVYFGAGRGVRARAAALELARRYGFAVHQLVYVEKKLARVEWERRDELRLELLSRPCSYAGLQARVRELVPEPEPVAPRPDVRFGRPRQGMCPIHIMAPERKAVDLQFALRERLDASLPKPAGEQMVADLFNRLEGVAGGEGGGVMPAVPRPIVLVPLDVHTRIVRGDGDEQVLQLADGTTMTGAAYLQLLGEELEVALFHPEEGAVNLYRGSRFANAKQRTLATLTTPGCAWVGCGQPAHACEVHHVTAWKHGGETNMGNLVMLCPYHNRVNNDDPGPPGGRQKRRRKAGRIVMMAGRPTWMSWRGYLAPNTDHPPGAMELLFGPAQST